ncbi:MAG TPA: HD domain-containing protein [Pyrinomonadaceae bacterium]|nr:HD domain-containing protein [Pyrinomonadaceae bacterium]
MTPLPEKVLSIAEAVSAVGGRAMLVGGCVRDDLMGVEPKDWDVEVFGVDPARLREILDSLGNVDVVGEAFAVYKLGGDLDVSIPRRERKSGPGHRGFIVDGDPHMSFEQAALRRDFTVNAISRDMLSGEIVDPFDGQGDIHRRLLKMVASETFGDDSLRVFRAAQFAARFQFDIDDDTIKACRRIDVTDLPRERIWGEFEKLLLKPDRPSIGLKWLYELGVVRQIFPGLQSLVGVPQEPEWHPEGDVDVHTMMVLDEARKLIDDLDHPRQVAVMLGALAHDLGKPPTTEFIDGRTRSRGHDEAGVTPTLSFLDTLGVFTIGGHDVRHQVVQLVRYHLKPGEYYNSKTPVGDGAFRRLARKVEPDLLYRVAKADSLGRNPDWLPKEKWFGSEAQEWFIEKVRELQIEKKAPEPILMGRHLMGLGLDPSPRYKKILDAVYESQLDGRISNIDEALAMARTLLDRGDDQAVNP